MAHMKHRDSTLQADSGDPHRHRAPINASTIVKGCQEGRSRLEKNLQHQLRRNDPARIYPATCFEWKAHIGQYTKQSNREVAVQGGLGGPT